MHLLLLIKSPLLQMILNQRKKNTHSVDWLKYLSIQLLWLVNVKRVRRIHLNIELQRNYILQRITKFLLTLSWLHCLFVFNFKKVLTAELIENIRYSKKSLYKMDYRPKETGMYSLIWKLHVLIKLSYNLTSRLILIRKDFRSRFKTKIWWIYA